MGLWFQRVGAHGISVKAQWQENPSVHILTHSRTPRETLGMALIFRKLKTQPHASSNKVTSSIWEETCSSQTVSSRRDQAFEHKSLWRPFTFKPPQYLCWKSSLSFDSHYAPKCIFCTLELHRKKLGSIRMD